MFPLPTHISRYEIKGLIGRGGMGDLYLARDTNPNTNRLVAIKLLNASLDSGDLRERFARESRALAALNHPNIVNIYDSGEFEDSPFIVMEYVRGETLAEKIKRRAQMSTSQKLKLMEELCAGLAHAHEAGIIHRDIKPANLMVHQSGRLKILDFGIARVAEGSFTRAGLEMTQVNVRIGTPGFMSPEQIEGGALDHRSDLFAVGAVCYELLSYHEAFSGANTRQVEHKVLQGQPAPLAPLVEGLDPELVAIINRALEKDPARRYQNAATLEAALEHHRMRLGPANTPAPPDRTTPVPGQSQGVRPRGQRAEAAYERALAVYNEGAHEAARRFVLETLAEDPDHKDARALLERLEPRKRWTPPPPPPPRAAKPPAAVPPTAINTRAASSDEDSSSDLTIRIPNPRKVPVASTEATQRTPKHVPIASTDATLRPQKKAPVVASMEETMRPRARVAAPPPPPPPLPPPPRARSRPPSPPIDYRALWIRHRRTVQIAGVVVATLAVLVGGFYLFGGFGPQRLPLTITKPTGGTIVSKGIRCGTDGSNCSTSIVNGEPVELEARPDQDFVFAGYTGDCAPAGRTLMLAARTCGATFAPVSGGTTEAGRNIGVADGLSQVLTITPPQGGTILSAGITCGTMGTECSAKVPNGEKVTLRAMADTGFTFQRYTGDCGPSDESLMTRPRTCGAIFVPNQADSAPKPALPPVRPTPRSTSRGTVSTPAAPSLPPPIPSDPGPESGRGAGGAASSDPAAQSPGGVVPPPISREDVAKREIRQLMKDYCAAFEHLDLTAMRKVFPKAPAQMTDQFRQFKAVQCAVAGEPEFVKLDAESGSAQIEVPIKMVYDQKVGGVQKLDLLTTAKFSRPEARDSWRIDAISHKPKPK